MTAAGFEDVTIEPTRVYKVEEAQQFLNAKGIDADSIAAEVEGKFMSAFMGARKPTASQRRRVLAPNISRGAQGQVLE